MKDFLDDLIKETGDEYSGKLSDEDKFTNTGWIDTGSYALNALLSGSIYGGMPDNKVVAWAGEEAVGKTFFNLAVIKHFLDNNPNSVACIFESEHALDRKMVESRGIDPKRIYLVEVGTVQEFRTKALQIIEKACNDKDRPPMIFALDSLGNLSTNKEVDDIAAGEDKRDMTRTQLIRGAFRVLTLKLGKAKIPMTVTNHMYMKTGVSFGDPREMGGGGGLKFAASTIVYLSKAQYKEGTELKGAVITCTGNKSRFTKEKMKVKTLLRHDKGLDRYYGLVDIAEQGGIIKKVSTKYEFPDGTKAFEKSIINNPEKYFTQDILDKVEKYVQEAFPYGGGFEDDLIDEPELLQENA
jgi:RecA/RadA recombinase